MSTLLVDNYDSYTYNVFHLLAAVSGEEPIVVHNDMVSWRALSRWDFDAIVLSPGPGRPDRWHDFGVCADILRFSEAPVLGICLGHQGLGRALNATVSTAPQPMHGRVSHVRHSDRGLFTGIPQEFPVVRYHSLAVTGDLGPDGVATAWTPDGVVMGIEHASRPLWGVQFHPESVATGFGQRLLENFYALARARQPRPRRPHQPLVPPRRCRRRRSSDGTRLSVRTLPCVPDTEQLFERLFADREHAFWLDSATAPSALARSSYLGCSDGEDSLVLEYDVERGVVTSHRQAEVSTERASIFDVLDREVHERGIEVPEERAGNMLGGFVGYLGYECKADCGSPNVHRSDLPDAVMMLANRIVAVDHVEARTHLLATHGEDPREAERWLDAAEREIAELVGDDPLWVGAQAPVGEEGREAENVGSVPEEELVFQSGRGREQYLRDITQCQRALASGESYEVCLTDQFHADAAPDAWSLYKLLRRRNPAPFAAYLKLGEVAILSSSPERFLSVGHDRRVQARPIKGTAPRAADPLEDAEIREQLETDEKTFAEHLMIVDLLRNDLGRVCEIDSVRVPELMVVEAHSTVHQMISNVTGVLDGGCSPVDCVRACFPGGSMTGAPKLRTMEIIDGIEREARGVYSGSIGYFSLDGAVDLSIVIRTIVMRPGATTIGAGGAIVVQSDPEDEFEEILLKARAPMAALSEATTGSEHAWRVELAARRRESEREGAW